ESGFPADGVQTVDQSCRSGGRGASLCRQRQGMTAARAGVYYWKCDRPAAFHGVIRKESSAGLSILDQLQNLLSTVISGPFFLREAGGRGNHHTFLLRHDDIESFVRVEDGPEGDGYLAVESRILEEVAKTGGPVPRVDWTDVSRSRVPFSVQIIGFFDCPDLGKLHQKALFRVESIAEEIGRAIARWQGVEVSGFGPFSGESLQQEKRLRGFHSTYASYFML